MEESHSILRFARRFFAGTLLSRISGALRDMAMAFCFGASELIAAFMVAYRLANLFRRLLGEGSVQAGFIPHFESLPEREGLRFYRDTAGTMLVVLATVVGGIELVLWAIASYAPAAWAQIAYLAMWMVPGLLFICLYALNSALLQTQRSFFAPAVAPVLFNMLWVAAAFCTSALPIATAVHWLACGVVLAFALQWAFTARKVKQLFPVWMAPRLFSSEWKQLLGSLSLSIVGVGAVQINALLDAIFARLADPSGPAFLWYALRVQQLPLALFGLALSRALLPSLARTIREGDEEQYRVLLRNSLRYAAALMIPCTFALFALGQSGLNLLFGRGHFTPEDLTQTLYCLWSYGIGLLPSALILLLANGFYAKKYYTTPALISCGAVAFNVVLNCMFVFLLHWGPLSIALATSFSTLANAACLIAYLPKPLFAWDDLAKLSLAGAVAWGCTFAIDTAWGYGLTRHFSEQLATFCLNTGIYLASFLGAAHLLGVWGDVAIFFKTNATRTRRPEGR